jgi:hypothetical protein
VAAPPAPGSGEIAVATPPIATAPAATTADNAYGRGRAVAVMAEMCTIPYDFAHPELGKRSSADYDVADWGKVIKIADEHGNIGGRPITEHMIYVQGQRRTYKIDDDLNALGTLPAKVGDLLALCPEGQSDSRQLETGPLDRTITAITLSAAPRTNEIAALKPIHVNEMSIVADALAAKPRLDPARRYLIHASVTAADGALWKMDRYWLDVPNGIRGGELVAANKRLWIVVEHARFDGDGADKRYVVRAAAVLDDLFP